MGKFKKVLDIILFGTPFKVVYFILVIAAYNSITARRSFMTPFAFVVAGFGALMLLYRVVHYKQYVKTKNVLILVGFCLSFVISMMMNVKYGITENVQLLTWMCFQFFLLYTCDTNIDSQKYHKEFAFISHIFIIYTFVSVFTGLILLAGRISNGRMADGVWMILGYASGRLFGVYVDPNYGSIYSCITLILCLFFWRRASKVILKIFYLLNIILQFAYIVFSNSRTGLLGLVCSLAFITYLINIRYNFLKGKNNLKRQLSSLVLAVMIAVISFGMYKVTEKSYNYIADFTADETTSIVDSGSSSSNKNGHEEPLTIGRPANDTSHTDISNRRIDIWKSGLQIFLKSPIYGVSFRNIDAFAYKNLPKTYIIHNDFCVFNSLHNTFMDVLDSQGIIGITIQIAFVLVTLIYVIKFFMKFSKKLSNEDYWYFITLMAALSPIVVSMMLFSEGFLMNMVGTFLFWTFLGYLVHFIQEKVTLQQPMQNNQVCIDEKALV